MKRKYDNGVTHEREPEVKRSYDPEIKRKAKSKSDEGNTTKETIACVFLAIFLLVVFFGGTIWVLYQMTASEREANLAEENSVTIEEDISDIDEESGPTDDTDKTTTDQDGDEINYREVVEKMLEEEEKKTIDPENPYNLPHSYFVEQAMADKMIERYLSGEWDGYPTEEEGHMFSLSYEGRLHMDSYLTSPSEIHPQHCLDLPKDMHRRDGMFILGEGTYLIEGWRIVKYSHGEKISLQGKDLDWSGMDTKNYRPYDTYFYYDECHDTLFIVASSVPYDYSDKEMVYNIGIYLYVMPDRSKSEIKFVDEIINLNIDELGLYYADTEGAIWRYVEKNGKLQFAKSSDKTLKNTFSKLGIAENEIEFDWWCTFADGYPGERWAFPEGTFTHPVTTTPSVGLTEIELSYRYKDIYSS